MSLDNGGGFEQHKPKPEITPFHEQLREASDSHVSALQKFSDKTVIDADKLSKLPPEKLQLLKESVNQCVDVWFKADGTIRNAWNQLKHQEMAGIDNGERHNNYMAGINKVMNGNMQELRAELPFVVAVPIQAFIPHNGSMKAETCYVLYPPESVAIQEKYLTMALHSPNPECEAQLRSSDSMAHLTTHPEARFRFVQCGLLPRKDGTVASDA